MTTEIVLVIGGILTTIIGYFLIRTMSKLDATAEKTDKNINDIALLKQETTFKHDRLEEKMIDLKDSIDSLTNEIKALNSKMK